MNVTLGEAQIKPQDQQQLAPDVVSPDGKQELFQTLAKAVQSKKEIDPQLQKVADTIGASFSSRIKNPETVVQKVAQKRLQGRTYNLEDINDGYGSRFVVANKEAIPEAIAAIKKLAQKGTFSILKDEDVHSGQYNAHHLDIKTPQGARGEIQILLPHQEAEAVINHDTRALYGEKAHPEVKALQKRQAELVKQLPPDRAHQLAQKIVELHKQNGDKPLPATANAALLHQAMQT